MPDDQSLMRIADNLSLIAKALETQTRLLNRIAGAAERNAGDSRAMSAARTTLEGD